MKKKKTDELLHFILRFVTEWQLFITSIVLLYSFDIDTYLVTGASKQYSPQDHPNHPSLH